jgi:outer membrane protein
MKKIFLILSLTLLLNQQAIAVTLSQALLQAYKNNPELNAARENIKVSKENLNISKSEFLPSLTLSTSRSAESTEKLTNRSGANVSSTNLNPKTQSIAIEQKLFQGFAGVADFKKNKIGLNLADAKLLKSEQETIYSAIEAYTRLVSTIEKLNINKKNVNLYERTVETARARLERGQITLSDLAQSESSLAGAQAKYIQASNDEITAKLNYEKVIGPITNVDDLNKDSDVKFQIPKNLDEAIRISKKNNPDLIIAKLEYEQSDKDIKIAAADLSPSATLSLKSSKTDDLSSSLDEQDKNTITATISWPLFKGGKNIALLNKSKNKKNIKKLLLDNAIKSNDTNVASAWSNLQSSRSLLKSVKLQVQAAEIANEGITEEYESGLGRSTLDVMLSNSILLDSKISLADSERNYFLSQFNLLQSVGLLKNDYLKLQ